MQESMARNEKRKRMAVQTVQGAGRRNSYYSTNANKTFNTYEEAERADAKKKKDKE